MTDETARVLHAIEHLGRGGAEAYVITLATEESRRGCRSVVIAREGDLTPKGVNFVSVPSGLRYAGWYSRAWAAHKANRFRLIVVHSMAPLPSLRAFALSHRIPLVFVFHAPWSRSLSETASALKVLRPNVIVAVSQELASGLASHGVQSRVIQNSVPDRNVNASTPGERQAEPHSMVYVARFSPEKRHDVLIDAFGGVAAELPHAHLHLVGDGPLLEDTRRLVRRSGLNRHVTFHGHREPHGVLQSTSLYVSASEREGLSLASIEALMWGLPLVITPTSGSSALVAPGENGLVASDFTASALRSSILEVFGQTLSSLARGSRTIYESDFSYERMIQQYRALDGELTGGKYA